MQSYLCLLDALAYSHQSFDVSFKQLSGDISCPDLYCQYVSADQEEMQFSKQEGACVRFGGEGGGGVVLSHEDC